MNITGDLQHLLIKVRGHFHFFGSGLKFQTLIMVLCTPSFREQKFLVPDSLPSFSVFSALWFMKEDIMTVQYSMKDLNVIT